MTFTSRWTAGGAGLLVIAAVAACATAPAVDYDKVALDMIKGSFRAQGQAGIEPPAAGRGAAHLLGPTPSAADLKRIETAELATIKPPPSGRYLGDWREGEKLAQNGRGMTWTDPAGAPAGGNCYNCHQMSKAEISFGTIGPSLYNYGKLRGVTTRPIRRRRRSSSTPGARSGTRRRTAPARRCRASAMRRCCPSSRSRTDGALLDPKSPVNQ
jgi:sulfur-oxidizing protein SoxX